MLNQLKNLFTTTEYGYFDDLLLYYVEEKGFVHCMVVEKLCLPENKLKIIYGDIVYINLT